MRRLTPVIFLLSLMIASCQQQSETRTEDTAQPAVSDTSLQPQTGFEDMSSDYYEAETRVIWQKPNLVLNLLGDLTDRTVADIGAGTGYFAFRIASNGGSVIAIDIDDRAIAWMESEKERYPEEVQERFQTRLATPDDPNLEKGEADIVLMVNTYMYIEDRVNYLEKLQEELKPGAEIIIIDFKKKETTIGPPVAERLALTRVQRELTEAGYAIISTDDDALEFQYIIKAARLQ